MLIADVLAGKDGSSGAGSEVVTITPDATVRDLVARLADRNVGALVVSADGTTVDGIVSERDVVRLLHRDSSALGGSVRSIMTAQVHTCAPTASVDDLMGQMTRHRIRHVPVVVDGSLAGIVSIGDVVKSRIGELEFEREQLSSYIAGSV